MEKFPPEIGQVKTIVLKMVYFHKQIRLENLVEAIQEIFLNNTLKMEGLSFCLTRYKTGKHTAPNCLYEEGFSITKATIDLFK